MDHINEKNGGKDVRVTTRAAIRAAHDSMADKPRQADKHIQTIRMLWNYAKNKLDWPLGNNPAANIDLFGKQKEFEPWPAWMIEKLDSAPDRVRVAAELILGTGQRPSAAIMMTWSQFNGEWMDVTDEKGDETYTVYCPKPLRDFLAVVRKEGRFVLAKNLTEQVTYDGVASAFQKWRKTLGPEAKKYTLHGLRKLAIVRLAEAGCTDAQIQAVTNQSAEMVAYYRKRASRKILSEEAHKKVKPFTSCSSAIPFLLFFIYKVGTK
jgi:integrase